MMGGLLSGVRVLDLTRMLAGPYGSLLLADLGAEVIKIEEPREGDGTRLMGPRAGGESAYFVSINRNKKSLTLNLKDDRGRAIFYELVRRADVVYDNFRPGILERLQCDYATLKRVNPRIIACSVSAFGQDGPYKDLPAFDLILQAMGGAMSITGEPGRPPVRMGIPLGDLAGGMFAAFAITAALYRRQLTGQGERIDLSLLDCQVSLLTYVAQYYLVTGEVPGPIGSAHQSVVPYQAFRTRDIDIVVAIFVEKFWERLCRILGRPELARDPRFETNAGRLEHKAELLPILEQAFLERTGDEWIEILWKEEIPAAPINTVDRVLADPQVRQRQMVVEVNHPAAGGALRMVGNPVKVTEAEEAGYAPSPTLGAHTDDILRSLGYTAAQIAEWREAGVI
ncbi:MAG: CoA transferase [Deltaproteobacteria bacterium]|nr:CoA transferase [Deltaproteobacteria bacterium]